MRQCRRTAKAPLVLTPSFTINTLIPTSSLMLVSGIQPSHLIWHGQRTTINIYKKTLVHLHIMERICCRLCMIQSMPLVVTPQQ